MNIQVEILNESFNKTPNHASKDFHILAALLFCVQSKCGIFGIVNTQTEKHHVLILYVSGNMIPICPEHAKLSQTVWIIL